MFYNFYLLYFKTYCVGMLMFNNFYLLYFKTYCVGMLMFNNFYLLYFKTDLFNNYVTQIDHMNNFIGSITTSNLVSRTFFENNS